MPRGFDYLSIVVSLLICFLSLLFSNMSKIVSTCLVDGGKSVSYDAVLPGDWSSGQLVIDHW